METEKTASGAWLIGVLAWLLPGSGHFLQGRWVRGLILGGCVVSLFIIGIMLGGHLFDFRDFSNGILAQVFGLFDLGSGLLYAGAQFLSIGTTDDAQQAQRVTYEYGNTFLMVAGLINYLAMLDAFDIRVGRKS